MYLALKLNGLVFKKKKIDSAPEKNKNSHAYLIDSSNHVNNLELSGKIPNDGSYPDDFLFNKPLETDSNNDGIILNPIPEKGNGEQCPAVKEKKDDIKLEKRVFNFIKKSKDGRKTSEITELIKSIDENINVQEFLLMMIDRGTIKKYKNRYYINEFEENN